jgi:nicotinate-nucleotide adenylyltransferase
MRIGILGGSFNPPHVGHLVMAQEAHAQLGLDKVVFMPVAVAPHKALDDDPGPEERLELCRLAVAKDDRFGVSRLELERGGASYTVDTLRQLRETSPGDELVWIIGGDNALGLPAWREPEAVLELAALAVAEREEVRREQIAEGVRGLRGADRLVFFAMPRMDVSSSSVRARVREARPVRYLVPDDVARVIGARGYYRSRVSP